MKQWRARLAGMIDVAARSGELADLAANAMAAVFLALGDGLMLHGLVDPTGFGLRAEPRR